MKFWPLFFICFELFAQLGEHQDVPKTKKIDSILEKTIGSELLELTKTIDSLEVILFREDTNKFVFSIPLRDPIVNPRWRSLGGVFIDIAVSKNNIFALSKSFDVYRLKGRKWIPLGIKAKKITASGDGNLCLVGLKNNFFVRSPEGEIKPLRAKGHELHCLENGKVIAIHGKNNKISYFDLRVWKRLRGQDIKTLSAYAKDKIIGLRIDNSVWFYDGDRWQKLDGVMLNVTISSNGQIAGVGINHGAYIYDGGQWVNIRGVNLQKLVTMTKNSFVGLTQDGRVWKTFLP